MKVYKLILYYIDLPYKILRFPKGRIIKNFDGYFKKEENLQKIESYNKDHSQIYSIWDDGDFSRAIYNNNERILYRECNGRINYPRGKEVYDKYIREKQIKYKKKKLEKILSKEE